MNEELKKHIDWCCEVIALTFLAAGVGLAFSDYINYFVIATFALLFSAGQLVAILGLMKVLIKGSFETKDEMIIYVVALASIYLFAITVCAMLCAVHQLIGIYF